MNERILGLKPYPMVELARRKKALQDQGVEVFDFGTGDPKEPTPSLVREALCAAVPIVSQYPSVQGELRLRQAFCAWFRRRFGVDLDPETQALPSRGSKEAIFHLPLVLVDPSRDRNTVVYPQPGYPVMEIGSLYAGAQTHPVLLNASNDYLMRPEMVPEEVLARAAIVWLNYPHNPTGRDLPEELFRAWVEARERHGFVLCSDECYTEIYFGEKPRSLLEFGMEACLAFHSLSKRSGMTGYRSGMVCGDPELLAFYRRFRAGMGQAMPVFEQEASRAAWGDEVHVEERREIFGQKREVMLKGLRERGFEVLQTSSTFYLWVRCPRGVSDREMAARLLDLGIIVSPGSFFGPGNEEWFRFALVPSVEDCARALERIPPQEQWKKE
ncbi:MAG TPA: succinyldiaminopimelate transaminase [Planctomycetes bacterium]|nr:succinyldiaminopimelate transaminase [Planctomycetota bacterium]